MRLTVRKYFCDQADCPQRIFCERLPTVTRPWGRTTARLDTQRHQVALEVGAESAARVLAVLGSPVSADTLLIQLRRVVPAPAPVRQLGIDDWAWRKGQRYGTILVDLERHQVIDLLPDRDAATLTEWLKRHPEIELITRDRAGAYQQAAACGAPQAQQVADRWHLLKNLRETLERYLQRVLETLKPLAQGLAPAQEVPPMDVAPVPVPPAPVDVHPPSPRQQARFQAVKVLLEQGRSIRQVATEAHVALGTVRKYKPLEHHPGTAAQWARRTLLAGYRRWLSAQWNAGHRTAVALHAALRDQGYLGGYTLVRDYCRQLRLGTLPAAPRRFICPSARTLSWAVLMEDAIRMPLLKTFLDRCRSDNAEFAQVERLLTADEYLALGVRQSIYDAASRPQVHALFQRYLAWMGEAGLFDSSFLAANCLLQVTPSFDFVVVDEVQDLTAAQLALILKSLRVPGQFLLCGDSNQIVHPNFFSWASVKTLLWQDPELAERQAISVLRANFRNASQVTRVANDLLKVKHARFGSVDQESNFLVEAVAGEPGSVTVLPNDLRVLKRLDDQTRGSTDYAVLVLRDEDKAQARKAFGTPLVFSVQEAKGLEYPNIILFDFVGGSRQMYAQITEGVRPEDLDVAELRYSRIQDKADQSLEIYKFYINALYVAVTRAVSRVILIESDLRHPLLGLLQVPLGDQAEVLTAKQANRADWEREANKLELQGKREQATDIRRRILKQQAVPWEVRTPETLLRMEEQVQANPGDPKLARGLVDFALLHHQDRLLETLRDLKVKPAASYLRNSDKDRRLQRQAVLDKYRRPFESNTLKSILGDCDRYGVDHRTPDNLTPLMLAAEVGNLPLIEALLERGADATQTDVFGRTPHLLALNRAFQDAGYAARTLGAVDERVRPQVLDVLVADRLVRLASGSAEFLFLSVMLATLPAFHSSLQDPRPSPEELKKRQAGYFVDALRTHLEHFPLSVLRETRRPRTYFNQVLARAEVNSVYQPAWDGPVLWTKLIRVPFQGECTAVVAAWVAAWSAVNSWGVRYPNEECGRMLL